MAQFWVTPNPSDLGSFPNGWVARWQGNESELSVQESAGEIYWLYAPSGGVKLFTMDTPDGNDFTAIQDVELFFDCDFSTTNTGADGADISPALRALRSNTRTCYAHGIRPGMEVIRLTSRVNGNFNEIDSAPFPRFSEVDRRLGIRSRCVGNEQKVKWWRLGDAEPGWALEQTDNSITAAMGVGFQAALTGGFRLFGVGVGTNGDPAPTGPVVAGAPTLSKPTATSVSATSISFKVPVTF